MTVQIRQTQIGHSHSLLNHHRARSRGQRSPCQQPCHRFDLLLIQWHSVVVRMGQDIASDMGNCPSLCPFLAAVVASYLCRSIVTFCLCPFRAVPCCSVCVLLCPIVSPGCFLQLHLCHSFCVTNYVTPYSLRSTHVVGSEACVMVLKTS